MVEIELPPGIADCMTLYKCELLNRSYLCIEKNKKYASGKPYPDYINARLLAPITNNNSYIECRRLDLFCFGHISYYDSNGDFVALYNHPMLDADYHNIYSLAMTSSSDDLTQLKELLVEVSKQKVTVDDVINHRTLKEVKSTSTKLKTKDVRRIKAKPKKCRKVSANQLDMFMAMEGGWYG